MLRATSGAP
jgi:hypothetical protein